MDKALELYLVIRLYPEMLEGTTWEEIARHIERYVEKSGYCIDDAFVEEAIEEDEDMEQKIQCKITLTDGEICALGNLAITLFENKESFEYLIDRSGLGTNLWDLINSLRPALESVVRQLPEV